MTADQRGALFQAREPLIVIGKKVFDAGEAPDDFIETAIDSSRASTRQWFDSSKR